MIKYDLLVRDILLKQVYKCLFLSVVIIDSMPDVGHTQMKIPEPEYCFKHQCITFNKSDSNQLKSHNLCSINDTPKII